MLAAATAVKMPARKGLLAPQNNFLDTIATRFDGTRKFHVHCHTCSELVTAPNPRLIEHGLTAAPTQYRLYGRRARSTTWTFVTGVYD